MPRPSLKDTRREEILEAYGRCVAQYGVDGATLERTAEEAAMARSLIRHNVGNKEALLDAFVDWFLAKSLEASDVMFAALPQRNRLETLIEWLFTPGHNDAHSTRVTNALVVAAGDQNGIAERLNVSIESFTQRLSAELAMARPRSNTEEQRAAAVGLAALYFNFDALQELGGGSDLARSSRDAARLLLKALPS